MKTYALFCTVVCGIGVHLAEALEVHSREMVSLACRALHLVQIDAGFVTFVVSIQAGSVLKIL